MARTKTTRSTDTVARGKPVLPDPKDPPRCPVCSGGRAAHYLTYRGTGDGLTGAVRGEAIETWACLDCETVYMYPLPEPARLAEVYDGTCGGGTEGYFAKVGKKLRRSRWRMRRLRWLTRGRRFLDIGCSGGFMAEAAREQGFDAHGLDLDPVAVEYAREHYPENRYHVGPVDTLLTDAPDEGWQGFDLIYSAEVIEHVPDVNGFVATIAELLNPGGVFFVTTPDITHRKRPADVLAWDGFGPPGHCIYFTPQSLKDLLERHGLQVIRKWHAPQPTLKYVCRKVG